MPRTHLLEAENIISMLIGARTAQPASNREPNTTAVCDGKKHTLASPLDLRIYLCTPMHAFTLPAPQSCQRNVTGLYICMTMDPQALAKEVAVPSWRSRQPLHSILQHIVSISAQTSGAIGAYKIQFK